MTDTQHDPRPWPAGTWPTAEQLFQWLTCRIPVDDARSLLPEPDRVAYLDALIEEAQRTDALERSLHRYGERVEALIAETVRLRGAWLSARRRARVMRAAVDQHLKPRAPRMLFEDPRP